MDDNNSKTDKLQKAKELENEATALFHNNEYEKHLMHLIQQHTYIAI